MAKLKVAFVKDLLTQVSKGDISFSRMCELMNEEASRKEEPKVVAYEWHNHKTGHCYVDYVPHPGQGATEGYEKTPLYYKEVKTSYPLRFNG